MADIDDECEKESRQLADAGFECLWQWDYQGALDIAKELEELRYSAAFDIGAQAYAGLGDLEKAIETLERGVAKAPDCWLNWQLLGNYRSDMGDYDKAAETYERALACPDVWEDSIRLNQAILAGRCGEHERELSLLGTIEDPDLSLQVASSRVGALWCTGRIDEALSLADECLNKEWEVDYATEHLARIAADQCHIRLEKGVPPEDVRRTAMDAIEDFGSHGSLLWLIRDIDGKYSEKAQYFRLLIHGVMPDDHALRDEPKGYYVTCDVVAETADQALGFLREIENAEMGPADLALAESEVLEQRPESPMGVYTRSPAVCYEREDDDEGEE
ncbi:MAG: hypothetical protein ACYSWO_09080 [Planctomycetota bacterium]|jgi:tetratricopeptide (TPR) repeat protein